MGKLSRRAIGLLLAFAVTYSVATCCHTLMVLQGLNSLNIQLDSATIVKSLVKDWLYMLPTYGVMLFVLLFSSFLLTTYVRHRVRFRGERISRWIFPVVGALAILLTLNMLYPILDFTLIAGARGFWGMLLQGVAGLCGGLVYMYSVEWMRKRARGRAKQRHLTAKQRRSTF